MITNKCIKKLDGNMFQIYDLYSKLQVYASEGSCFSLKLPRKEQSS